MARHLDNILVIDLESTCWDGPPPDGQVSEIIEIGITQVDVAALKRMDKRSILIKPQHSDISAFCTELTTLTPDMPAHANGFKEAMLILKAAYNSQERLWASWGLTTTAPEGGFDRCQFERCCQLYDESYPFGPSHLNVKTLFALAMGLPHEVGLDEAYRQLGWTLEGTHHRGEDDAWNIAGVLCWLLQSTRNSAKQKLANTRSLLELEGLGAETWNGVDGQEYVDELRDEWEARPE